MARCANLGASALAVWFPLRVWFSGFAASPRWRAHTCTLLITQAPAPILPALPIRALVPVSVRLLLPLVPPFSCARECMGRWRVSYEVEVEEAAAGGRGAPAERRPNSGKGCTGGIYFDEEGTGACGQHLNHLGNDQRLEDGPDGRHSPVASKEKDTDDETWRQTEEWVHPRFVRPRSIRYIAGECPPQPGAAVLATLLRDGEEVYYDADVVHVRVVAGKQDVLVEYVHGEMVGETKWLPLSDIFRLCDRPTLPLGLRGQAVAPPAEVESGGARDNPEEDETVHGGQIEGAEGKNPETEAMIGGSACAGEKSGEDVQGLKQRRQKQCANVKTVSTVSSFPFANGSAGGARVHKEAMPEGRAPVVVLPECDAPCSSSQNSLVLHGTDAGMAKTRGEGGVGVHEMDYSEVLRTWQTAAPEMVSKFKETLLQRFPFLPPEVQIASGVNLLLDGSGVLQYMVYVGADSGLPEIKFLTPEQWTSGARLLQARGRFRRAAMTEATHCGCGFERWHVPLDLQAVRELPHSIKVQRVLAPSCGGRKRDQDVDCSQEGGGNANGGVQPTTATAADPACETACRATPAVTNATENHDRHHYFPALFSASLVQDCPSSKAKWLSKGKGGPAAASGREARSEASTATASSSNASALTFKPLHNSWWPPTLDHVFLSRWSASAQSVEQLQRASHVSAAVGKPKNMGEAMQNSGARRGDTRVHYSDKSSIPALVNASTGTSIQRRKVGRDEGWRVAEIHGIRALVAESVKKGSIKEDRLLNPPALFRGHVVLQRVADTSPECPKGRVAWRFHVQPDGSDEVLVPGVWMRKCGNTTLRPLNAIRLVLPTKLHAFMASAQGFGGQTGRIAGGELEGSVRLGAFLDKCGATFENSSRGSIILVDAWAAGKEFDGEDEGGECDHLGIAACHDKRGGESRPSVTWIKGDREKREGPLRKDKREKGHKGANGMKQRNENRSCTLSSGSSAERKRHFARVWDDNFESLKEFMQQHRHSHQTWPAVALVHIFACLCIMNTHARMCAHGHSVCGRT